MKPRLLEILQHTLGCDQYGRGTHYRNHFVAGGKDAESCEELLRMGLMTKHPRRGGAGDELTGGMPCYFVTDAGKREMLAQSPRVPRSKRSRAFEQWQSYCDAFGNIPFSRFWKEVWPNRDQYA